MPHARADNGVLFQFFHWYASDEGQLWNRLADVAEDLSLRGITAIWIPPAFKGAYGATDVGYTVYDMWDLGEFDQKGTVRTKYGTKDELVRACLAVQAAGMDVVADVVHNHRAGGDETEEVRAVVVAEHDRLQVVSEPMVIHAWTRFRFPGRGGRYSTMELHAAHFVAVDAHAEDPASNQVYLLEGKAFSADVSQERANFDFLMGCDLDLEHPEVVAELDRHGTWLVENLGVSGFRIDAAKHVSIGFTKGWLQRRIPDVGRPVFAVAEYPTGNAQEIVDYAAAFGGEMAVFDTPLHDRFFQASHQPDFDLRTIFDGALVAAHADVAVTFVDSHDTEPGCTLESWVDDWFRPLAYALILLRPAGYPCVFYPDFFSEHRAWLDPLLVARRDHNYGDLSDRFESPTCIGWIRGGDAHHPGRMAVVMSTGEAGSIRFLTGVPGGVFRDLLGNVPEPAQADGEGAVDLRCGPRSVSVWIGGTIDPSDEHP